MTESLDLDAIEAMEYGPWSPSFLVQALIAELRATREVAGQCEMALFASVNWQASAERAEAAIARIEVAMTAADGMCANCHHGDAYRAALRGDQ